MRDTEIKDNKLLKREGLYLKLKSAIDIILIFFTIGVIGYFVRDCLSDDKLSQELLLKPIYSALFLIPVFLLINSKLKHIVFERRTKGKWNEKRGIINNMLTRLKTFCKKAKVEEFCFHDLR